ncbi:MAG: hypothetical protein F9K16_06255 [Thermoanaerobaculia bacterium]|nr:MAG: hypothetical protein F9K16_06255 [Thermoanaerobaculia bacterium]
MDWSYTPLEAVQNPNSRRTVVWLGRVESVATRAEGGKVTVEWLCRHLEFAVRGPGAIASAPVQFRSSESGYFVINLVLDVPAEAAADLEAQFEVTERYVLAAGHISGMVNVAGHAAAFLATEAMTQADDLGKESTN